VRVVVRVLDLLLMPAMDSGTGEFDPLIIAGGSRLLRGKVAAGAYLSRDLARPREVTRYSPTYVFRLMRALCDVAASSVSQVLAPDKVLSAMEASPVPVCPHHGTNEAGVIGVRSVVVVEVAWLDVMCGCSDGSGDQKGSESSEWLHVCLLMSFTARNDHGVLIWVSQRLGRRRVGALDRGCRALRLSVK
jgi:hypothetical protein